MNLKPDLHLISFRREFEILDGLPHACLLPVRSALPLPVLITSLARLSKPFLFPGSLQNTRHQAFKAVVISQINTAEVRAELHSKEPDATSFVINLEETLWEQEIIIRKTDCFERHVCLLSSTCKQPAKRSAKPAKLVSFIQSCC